MQLEAIGHVFEGQIRTDFTGFRQLISFYNSLKEVYDREVFLDFSQLDWFDANLAAVLCAFQYKLQTENGLTFVVDHRQIAGQFDVLHRNGCFQPNEERIEDVRQSTIACMHFHTNNLQLYKQYVEKDLFEHRGLAELSRLYPNTAKRIRMDLLEIFNNYRIHAQTMAPFFVCGQYYPQDKRVVFTMSDIGVGFLPPIQTYSQGIIITSQEAIHWALTGHSTQASPDETSGCGLSSILSFCDTQNADLQVITGDSFWSRDLIKTSYKGYKQFKSPFAGTTINITFNT
jgi:anti-anti-sigma regulatory factor